MTDRTDRFWAKVDRTGEHWLWTGCVVRRYGQFGRTRAHRYAYELLVGPIPPGYQLDHLCRTPLCVRPDHLEPVTPRENTLRGNGPTARHARKTHCIRGHALVGDNVYHTPHRPNGRECWTCKRMLRAMARSRSRVENVA